MEEDKKLIKIQIGIKVMHPHDAYLNPESFNATNFSEYRRQISMDVEFKFLTDDEYFEKIMSFIVYSVIRSEYCGDMSHACISIPTTFPVERIYEALDYLREELGIQFNMGHPEE